jgi:hypothetical protein
MGEVIIKCSGPLLFIVAPQTPVQDFLGNTLVFSSQSGDRLIDTVFMAIDTSGKVLCMFFEVSLSIFAAMYAHLILFDHSGMGKVLAGGGINKVADGSTIYFFSIGMRVLFNLTMTFLAADFTVNRLLK